MTKRCNNNKILKLVMRMKIAISSTGKDLEAFIDRRFERCSYFLIVDTETMNYDTVFNIGTAKKDGTSSTALDIILNNGVEAVITGDMRRATQKILSNAKKKVITGVTGRIKNVVEEFRINEIKKCPLCGANDLVRDYEKMKVICNNCGLETSGII